MYKKQLMIAAMAAVLSVSTANATNITGITGNNGVFNIDPATVSGNVGYRHYNDFNLSQGDIANLIYQGYKNGDIRNIDAFINLVQNHIDINGVVNTMRNGNFYNGHAIFVSPNGMTVGASGVLNVGQLSVITPKDDKFNELTNAFNKKDYATMNKVSQLRSSGSDVINYGGNAPVKIEGTILARNGVDIRGSKVDILGNIANGVNDLTTKFLDGATAQKDAADLFDTLVNTEGLNNGSLVIVKSGKGANAGINIVSGAKIANLATASEEGNAETAITNHGDLGLTVAGTVSGKGKLNVYNNNAKGDLVVSGAVANQNDVLALSNRGEAFNLTGNVGTDNALEIVNNGTEKLTISGSALSNGKTDIVNRSDAGMEVTNTGKIGNETTSSVRIVNRGGKLAFAGTATAAESVSLRNEGTEMTVGGTVNAGEGILVHNKKGNATLNGKLIVAEGNVAIMNEGSGKLTTENTSQITNNGRGNIAIKNASTGGMELNGTITNKAGEVAINNLAGAATVNGTITNTGNMGIINKENGTGLTIGATINNAGKMKLVNSTGVNGLTIDGAVNNTGNDLYVYNDAGHLTINGTLANSETGDLYVASRKASTGITTGTGSLISNEGPDSLALKHDGTSALEGKGMDLKGTITADGGEIAINNYKGDMSVAGTINATDGNLGIINRQGGDSMTVDATINANNNQTNIKNYGSGNMAVNGEITHYGRLNVLANTNKLTLGGKIHNKGNDMTYAAARDKGTGIEVKNTFNADANGGTILIKNITGENGLIYDGTMTNTDGLAEVYNKAGDMTVTGAINATGAVDKNGNGGASAVVLNKGNNLTVTDKANLEGEVRIVNKGKNNANIADKYKRYFREQLSK